eukprot:7016403-Lingulodinium_polyedra.AAC.1
MWQGALVGQGLLFKQKASPASGPWWLSLGAVDVKYVLALRMKFLERDGMSFITFDTLEHYVNMADQAI